MKVSNQTAIVKAKKARKYYAYATRLYVNEPTQVKLACSYEIKLKRGLQFGSLIKETRSANL
jgi:hypothetical protein